MEINGIEYSRRVKSATYTPRSFSRTLMMLSAMSAMIGGGARRSTKELNVDIVEEFKLIQEKKSKLTRADRDLVERRFNNIYEKML